MTAPMQCPSEGLCGLFKTGVYLSKGNMKGTVNRLDILHYDLSAIIQPKFIKKVVKKYMLLVSDLSATTVISYPQSYQIIFLLMLTSC